MKQFISVCLCLALFFVLLMPVQAAEESRSTVISQKEYILDNGLTVIEEITERTYARSSTKYGEKRSSLKRGDTTIAIIIISGQFGYDQTKAWVISKNQVQVDTNDGWSYQELSYTSSGATISLTYKLTKLLLSTDTYTLSLTCDKNGNIS